MIRKPRITVCCLLASLSMILTGCASGASTGANGTTTTPGTQSTTLTVKNFMGKTYQIGDSKSTLTFTTQNALTAKNGFSQNDIDRNSKTTVDDGRVTIKFYDLSLTTPYSDDRKDYTAYSVLNQCPALTEDSDDIDDADVPWQACPQGTLMLMLADTNVLTDMGGQNHYSYSLTKESSYYVTLHEGKLTMTQLAYDPEDPNHDTPKDFQRQQKLTNNFVALTPVTAKH